MQQTASQCSAAKTCHEDLNCVSSYGWDEGKEASPRQRRIRSATQRACWWRVAARRTLRRACWWLASASPLHAARLHRACCCSPVVWSPSSPACGTRRRGRPMSARRSAKLAAPAAMTSSLLHLRPRPRRHGHTSIARASPEKVSSPPTEQVPCFQWL